MDPLMKIGSQVEETLRIHTQMPKEERHQRALAAMAAAELPDPEGICDKYPHELSGGMRQRAALIRTLVLEPELLLLDEPFSALDYQTRLNVSDDIGKILKSSGKPAILVTHDISEAISMADRVLILSARPATVRKIIDIDLDISDRTPLSSRNAPDFKKYFNIIWKELNENA